MTGDGKTLGYGGSAVVDGLQVLITSGNFDSAFAISYLQPLDIVPSSISRSRVKHADGTAAYTGSISFDVTEASIAMMSLSRLLDRHYTFGLAIDDGESGFQMTGCKLTSLSMSGAPGGLITASVSAMSTNGKSVATPLNAYMFDTPAGYWWSGGTDIRDWSFTMNQAVTPMYRNKNEIDPRYLKVGTVDYTLTVTTYSVGISSSLINIVTATFSLTGDTTSRGYSFGGQNELGMYTHTFETAAAASAGSGGIIIA